MRGRPFPRRTSHKLDCGWCGYIQDYELIQRVIKDRKKISYPCDRCTRRLAIQTSANGFYTAHPADKARYLKNVSLKKNRI
jgi:uncharacterized protein YlaI